MTFTKLLAFGLLFFVSSYSHAQDDTSLEAIRVMEEGLSANEELFDFLNTHPCELGMQSNCERPLSGQELGRLKELLNNLAVWKANAHEKVVPKTDLLNGMPFTLHVGEAHLMSQEIRFNPNTWSNEKYLRITYGLHDNHSRFFAQNIRIFASITILTYDSFFRLAQVLAKAKKLTSIIEYDMPEHGGVLKETYAMAMDEKFWNRVSVSLDFLKQEKKIRESHLEEEETYFDQYLEKSFTATQMNHNEYIFRMRSVLFLRDVLTQTRFMRALENIVGKLSEIFGNTVGGIQSRSGKLKALTLNPEIMKVMKSKLRPLDILFEKTPFRLTDKFIPGYYGHVAIWLGTPEELSVMKVKLNGRTISLLDHPKVTPFLERMSQGRLVVEALRAPGVTMNTLEHFLDVDDFLVVKSSAKLSPAEHVLRALDQVGKPYDFNFDVETERAIVCSELVYTVFTDYQWPTSRSMGRYTISPDHVAWKTVDSCFMPTMMYTDGKEVKENMRETLKSLLERPGGISYTPVGNCQ